MRADYPHTAYQVDFRSRHAPPPDTDPPPIADPDGSVHALSQMTPQEVETLTAARQVDHARLLPDATPARVGPAPSRPALAPPQRPRPQCRAEFREARVDTALLNLRQRLRIDPGRATIPLHPPPRLPEDVIPPDPVHQGLEAPRRGPLGRGPEASLQLAHFVERPRLSGELGPVSPAMPSRVLAPTPCPPQGPFPPAACCCAALTGTIAPSDSRCAAAAFTFGLCGPRCPDPGRADGPLVFRPPPCPRAAPRTPPKHLLGSRGRERPLARVLRRAGGSHSRRRRGRDRHPALPRRRDGARTGRLRRGATVRLPRTTSPTRPSSSPSSRKRYGKMRVPRDHRAAHRRDEDHAVRQWPTWPSTATRPG